MNTPSPALLQQKLAGGRFRLRHWVLGVFIGYGIYLLLLGPFWALDGRGYIPDCIHWVVWAPALIWKEVPGVHDVILAYLDWWYLEPHLVETTR